MDRYLLSRYVDIDLEKNYNLDEVKVYLPTTGYSQYDIYTSMDGENFTKIYSKTDKNATPVDGDVIDLRSIENREARIIRVYVNYQSGTSTNVSINEVKIYGEESGTESSKWQHLLKLLILKIHNTLQKSQMIW